LCIAPCSGIAVRHGIEVNADVLNVEYTGQIGVVLVNLFDKDHHVRAGDHLAQLIRKRILQMRCKKVQDLEETNREDQGFGSTDEK